MRFTKDHEWVSLEGGVATIGVTAFAADQLGDVVFVETPELGRAVKKGAALAVGRLLAPFRRGGRDERGAQRRSGNGQRRARARRLVRQDQGERPG